MESSPASHFSLVYLVSTGSSTVRPFAETLKLLKVSKATHFLAGLDLYHYSELTQLRKAPASARSRTHYVEEMYGQERRWEGERGNLPFLVPVNYYASSCETIF